MFLMMALVFGVGYLFIALEHLLKIDKSASALLTGMICWTLLMFGKSTLFSGEGVDEMIHEELMHHISEIAQIIFFLLGAMTIVELIDAHGGFEVITTRITTTDKVQLLWIVGFVTFFLSSVLDNLTTAIVMAALLKKLIDSKEDLWFFAGVVVIAANAGGAWSPIGDVTTIMLWIGGQVSAGHIVKELILPSLACLIAPLAILSVIKKGIITRPTSNPLNEHGSALHPTRFDQMMVLWIGIGGLLFVPIFKSVTHLPPFMGMLFSLGVLWVVTELLHRKKPQDMKHSLSVASIMRRIDTPSVLFFLGILMAVASLQTAGHLGIVATSLDKTFGGDPYSVNILIGLLSSVVDNVPLVAGAMGMYSLDTFPQDNLFWELLAYCAGTGGSVLIIGSAAGVAIMGILKIDFVWYLKKISWLALIGYFAGVLVHYIVG